MREGSPKGMVWCYPPVCPIVMTPLKDGSPIFGGGVALLDSSLERASQFIKAFGERRGDLHVTECQHREVTLMPLHQPEKTR